MNPVAVSLGQVIWSSFWLYSCSAVFSAVTELTSGLIQSPDITFPRLWGSLLTQTRRPGLPGCGDQAECLPPAHRGHLMLGQSFISLISMIIKWVYVLVTPGSLPCKHSGRPCSKPWSLHRSRASFAWPCSSEFAMIHSQHVPCVLSEMLEMIFFSLWLPRALSAGMSLARKRCFIRVHWKNEWLNGDTAVFLKLKAPLEDCENTDCRVPPPEFLPQWVWGGPGTLHV